jgi:hypothetical protein
VPPSVREFSSLDPPAGVSFGHSVEGTQTWRRPNKPSTSVRCFRAHARTGHRSAYTLPTSGGQAAYALRSTPAGGRLAGPTPERARKRTRLGVAQRRGDIGQWKLRVIQQLASDLEANLTQNPLKVHALLVQMSVESTAMQEQK